MMLAFVHRSCKRLSIILLSERSMSFVRRIDRKGIAKSPVQVKADKAKANRILDIVKNYDPVELEILIRKANKTQPDADLDNVVSIYISQKLHK